MAFRHTFLAVLVGSLLVSTAERRGASAALSISASSNTAARKGLVRGEGSRFIDDLGAFRPKGTTLLWALYGWKHGDRERVRQHLAYVSGKHYDFVRVLAQVDWPNQSIDPEWSDFADQLASLIDTAYDEFQLRVKVTVIGGGAKDPLNAARKVVQVIQGRQHKIFSLEATNEANLGEEQAVQVASILKTAGVPLVSVGMGNQDVATILRASAAAVATKIDVHPPRNGDAARQLRQTRTFKAFFGRPVENAEPPGIASSGGQLNESLQMGAFRTLGIIAGAGAFCLHTGNGVYGRVDPSMNRQANVWEAAGIDDMFDAVGQAGEWLPEYVEDWPKFTERARSPIWTTGALNAVFGASNGSQFTYMVTAATGPTTIRAQKPLHVEVLHPISGEVLDSHDLVAGEQVPGPKLWAYVLVGRLS